MGIRYHTDFSSLKQKSVKPCPLCRVMSVERAGFPNLNSCRASSDCIEWGYRTCYSPKYFSRAYKNSSRNVENSNKVYDKFKYLTARQLMICKIIGILFENKTCRNGV